MILKSMTDYVLEQININQFDEDFTSKVVNYANFLKQPLTLGMFIPCDENGNVLEIPVNYEIWLKLHNNDVSGEKGTIGFLIHEEYQQAKERVLFKGFEIIKPSEKCFIILCEKNLNCQFLLNSDYSFNIRKFMDVTIEDLVKYNLELTDSAIKQINQSN